MGDGRPFWHRRTINMIAKTLTLAVTAAALTASAFAQTPLTINTP